MFLGTGTFAKQVAKWKIGAEKNRKKTEKIRNQIRKKSEKIRKVSSFLEKLLFPEISRNIQNDHCFFCFFL